MFVAEQPLIAWGISCKAEVTFLAKTDGAWMRIDALNAFYRSEKSCDNGGTALGDTYTFMRTLYITLYNEHTHCQQ